jgi:hypothetical protein
MPSAFVDAAAAAGQGAKRFAEARERAWPGSLEALVSEDPGTYAAPMQAPVGGLSQERGGMLQAAGRTSQTLG